jgi:hypothetical protein
MRDRRSLSNSRIVNLVEITAKIYPEDAGGMGSELLEDHQAVSVVCTEEPGFWSIAFNMRAIRLIASSKGISLRDDARQGR